MLMIKPELINEKSLQFIGNQEKKPKNVFKNWNL